MICSAIVLSSSAFAQANNSAAATDNTPKMNPNMPDYGLPDQARGSFNMSAPINLSNQWDLFFDASFILWNVNQDNMDLARSAAYGATTATPLNSASIAFQPSRYKPGFKVGIGFNTNYDDWAMRAEYTWLHQSHLYTFGATPSSFATGDTIWIPSDWFNALSASTQFEAGSINSNWRTKIDILDVVGGRPYYQSKQAVISPFGGLRAAWIREMLTVSATNAKNPGYTPAVSNNNSNCWSLGPVAGAQGKWLIGSGFRVQGDMAFGLLYTRYTKVTHNEYDQAGYTGIAPINTSRNNWGALRPNAEMGLGLGWGTYFMDKMYHLDFSAQYDFNLFWNQNVMRQLTGSSANNLVGYSNPAGDLFLHGLTLSGRFDF